MKPRIEKMKLLAPSSSEATKRKRKEMTYLEEDNGVAVAHK